MNNSLSIVRDKMIEAGRTRHLSNVLMKANVGLKRKPFIPTNSVDRLQYAYFIETGKWKDGQSFTVELPYNTVPATVQAKLIRQFLRVELEKVKLMLSDSQIPEVQDNVIALRKQA